MADPKFIFQMQPPAAPPGTEWEMWSAIATGFAAIVALALPFIIRMLDSRGANRQSRLRTAAACPGLVDDVMQVHWQLDAQRRVILKVVDNFSSASKAILLDEQFNAGTLLFNVFPGRTLPADDRAQLTDDVRMAIAHLHAMALATNTLWRQVLKGPFGAYSGPADSVSARLPDVMSQLLEVHQSCRKALQALAPYLPVQLFEMSGALEGQTLLFVALDDKARSMREGLKSAKES